MINKKQNFFFNNQSINEKKNLNHAITAKILFHNKKQCYYLHFKLKKKN